MSLYFTDYQYNPRHMVPCGYWTDGVQSITVVKFGQIKMHMNYNWTDIDSRWCPKKQT